MTEKQFTEITEWQKETFPGATMYSKIEHLKQELEEVVEEDLSIPTRSVEFADCFILLFGAAAAFGMTYQDITDAITHKFEINKKRKWGKPDENGVVNHIK